MIPKIPVAPVQELDIWPHADDASSRFKASKGLVEGPPQALLGGKMFEEIARENDVEAFRWQRPWIGTILREKGYAGFKLPGRIGIEIHPIFARGADLIHKFAPTATQIENSATLRNPSGEKSSGQNLPDSLSIGRVSFEAQRIFQLEFARHEAKAE